MQETWERRRAIIELSLEECQSLLEPFMGSVKVEKIKLISRGKLNTNYYVKTTGDNPSILIRIYQGDPKTLLKEKLISDLIKKNGFPCPEYWYVDISKENVIKNPYAIIEWIQADMLEVTTLDPKKTNMYAESLGGLLAKLKNYQFEGPGFFEEGLKVSPFHTGIQGYLNFIKEHLENPIMKERASEELCEELWSCVNKKVLYLEEVINDSYLVHGDFNFANFLFVNKPFKIDTYLIDWEFCFSGSQLFDMGNLLRYDEQMPKGFVQTFVEGYQENGGYLPNNWYLIAKLLDLLSLCDLMCAKESYNSLILDINQRLIKTHNILKKNVKNMFMEKICKL